ncbi:MAG: PDZ domain-containing protein [bacterium]|nr:PDZ domain-containing protein [bacterium]
MRFREASGSGRKSSWVRVAVALVGLVALGAASAHDSQVVISNELKDSPYLGVRLEEETDHAEGGARVTDVIHGSPAEEAGLEEGDVIVRFDGKTIRGPGSLTKRIHENEPGDRIELRVLRDGSTKELEIELGRRSVFWGPQVEPFEFDWVPNFDLEGLEGLVGLEGLEQLEGLTLDLGDLEKSLEGFAVCPGGDCEGLFSFRTGRAKLGVQLVEMTAELREHLGSDAESGVLVSKVLSNSPADVAGIEVGDLIVSVEGEVVSDAQDIRRAMRDSDGKNVAVEVIRDGRRETFEAPIPEEDEERLGGPRAYRLPRTEGSAPAIYTVPGADAPSVYVVAPAAPRVAAPPVPPRPAPIAVPAPPAPPAPVAPPRPRAPAPGREVV